MYEELITALRTCVDKEKGCDECPYYGKCMTTVGKHAAMVDAADAIEELSHIVHEYQKFDGFLAAHGMFEQGPIIPIEPPKEET